MLTVFLCLTFSTFWKICCFLLPVNKNLITCFCNMCTSWFHVIWPVSHILELNPVWEFGRWDKSLPPSPPTCSSASQRWKALLRTQLKEPLGHDAALVVSWKQPQQLAQVFVVFHQVLPFCLCFSYFCCDHLTNFYSLCSLLCGSCCLMSSAISCLLAVPWSG